MKGSTVDNKILSKLYELDCESIFGFDPEEIWERIKTETFNISEIGLCQEIYWYQLSEKEKEEFDYCNNSSVFYRFGGELFALEDFMRAEADAYDGINTTSYFSATIIYLIGTTEEVILMNVYW